MAKERMVNTKFWDDTYIVQLDPIEKLLYLYFLTNPLTNISGIYEIQIRRIAFDTGIDKDMVEKIIGRFTEDDKILYLEGWLAIKNFAKHQRDNPSVKKGIKIAFESIPTRILDRLGTDWGQTGGSLSHLNSNSNSNININSNIKIAPKTGADRPNSSKGPEKPKTLKEKKDPQEKMTLEQFIGSMRESKQRAVRLIGDYAAGIMPSFSTRGQWDIFLKRNLRPAQDLAVFTDAQIEAAMTEVQENLKSENNPKGYITKWTLETLINYIK